MNILSIETSGKRASLCLSLNNELAYSTAWESERNHDAYLFPALDAALSVLGNHPLHLILVGAGPGSYGGVRVAIAAAVGLSMVKECKIAAICSWLGLAENNEAIISDAKRGGWTIMRPDGDISVLSTDELLNCISDGLHISTIESAATLGKHQLSANQYNLTPCALKTLNFWNTLTEEEQHAYINKPAEPIYVRPPHITQAKKKPWEV